MRKKILSIAGAIVLLGSLVTMCFAVNAYFAKDSDFQLLSMRLDNKIIMDKINYWQTKIDRIKEKYEGKTIPPEAQRRIRDAEKEIKELERKLKKG